MDPGSSSYSPRSRRRARENTYKAYKNSQSKIPQTTLPAWKRKDNASNETSLSEESESSSSDVQRENSASVCEFEFSENSVSISGDSESKNSVSSCDDSKNENTSSIYDNTESASDSPEHGESSSDTEDSSDSDNSGMEAALSQCLYTGCEMSVDESVYKVMKIFLDNRLPKKALNDILNFTVSILPDQHSLPCSQYLLFKYVREVAPPFTSSRYYYCSNCIFFVGNKVPEGNCPACCENDTYNFISISLADQLKFLFYKRNLAEIIDSNRRNVTEEHPIDLISDITDGSEYLRVKCSLSGKYDLILTVNTDGIELRSSSTASLWPIMCTIKSFLLKERI